MKINASNIKKAAFRSTLKGMGHLPERTLKTLLRKRYYIKYQWKLYGGSYCYAVVPILFLTHKSAEDYLNHFAFNNMNQRKLSAAIEVRWLDEEKANEFAGQPFQA